MGRISIRRKAKGFQSMDYIELESVTSSHSWAKDHLNELKPNPILCITANEQTAGHGRKSRSWVSPRDQNLYATFVFYLPPTTATHNLCQIISLSTAHVLKNAGFLPAIKWPNDILLSNKKCAGVLCEITNQTAILSIGLNINMPKNLCDTIDQPATSLLVEKNKEFSITAMRNDISKQLEHDLKLFLKDGFAPFQDSYNALLARKGEPMTIQSQHGTLHGISSDGRLEIKLDNGTIVKTTEYFED